jgi:hypothetical protein
MNPAGTPMNSLRLLLCGSLLSFCGMSLLAREASAQAKITGNGERVTIENRYVSLSFNTKSGYFDVTDKVKNRVPVRDAFFQAEGQFSKARTDTIEWTQQDVNDVFGKGKSLVVTAKYRDYADTRWEATLYDNKEFIAFNMGIVNDSKRPYTLTSYYPLKSYNVLSRSGVKENFCVLNGNSGGNRTYAKDTTSLLCFNNIMIRCGDQKDPNILVAGGLTYHDFEKFCSFAKLGDSLNFQLWSEDPVGKLIDPGATYSGDDKFYLCVNNANPFEAMEKYGLAVREAQHIKLNYYDFPTECLWYASVYAQDPQRPKFNDTKGAVEEMENAIKSGFTKYSRVAIRLVPDAYGPDNQQGWWDDTHWAMWGDKYSANGANYVEPYMTTESWCAEIVKRGGIPMTYFQTNRRSEDFVTMHPDYMLFNDPHRISPEHTDRLRHNTQAGEELNAYYRQWWSETDMLGYDFTDPGFVQHMKEVYARLNKAGIKGIMYDYPEATGWVFAGGFEDKHATTAFAYRRIFELAFSGLGEDAYLDERMLGRGADVASGLIASQRIWGDNDVFVPEMVTRSGLRWYKNRVIVNYDLDAKDPFKAKPAYNNDGLRTLMTMAYVVSGRFLLARSFYQLSPEQLFIMSRTFPYHKTPQSSRPIDAFNKNVSVPRIFDFEVNQDWHQLTLYNPNIDSARTDLNPVNLDLGKSLNEGGLALDPGKSYYLYDFWNDRLTGKFNGDEILKQDLRTGETRMISIHTAEKHPQFLSTNRHIMQGYVDMTRYPVWDGARKKLSGTSRVVGGETYKIVIALNGSEIAGASARGAKASIQLSDRKNDLAVLSIDCANNADVDWEVNFK